MTYNRQGVHNNGIDMRAFLLVGHLVDLVDDVGPQSELLDALNDTGMIKQGINKENGALGKRCHLAESRIECRVADLRRDGEEEPAPLRHLALHPHVALHQRHKALRDGQSETSATIFLSQNAVSTSHNQKRLYLCCVLVLSIRPPGRRYRR